MGKEPLIPDMPEFLIQDAKARDEARKMEKVSKTLAPAGEVGSGEAEIKPRKAGKQAHKGNGKDTGKTLKAAAKPTAKTKKQPAKRAPRTQDPGKLDEWGLRKGSLKSRAAAMYAGKKGATLKEVEAKLESTQFNVLNELTGKGFKVRVTKEDGNGKRQTSRYFLSK